MATNMRATRLLVLLCVVLAALGVVIENEETLLSFSEVTGSLTRLFDKQTNAELVDGAAAEEVAVWSLHFVDEEGPVVVTSRDFPLSSSKLEMTTTKGGVQSQALLLQWHDMQIRGGRHRREHKGTAWAEIRVELAQGAQLSEWWLRAGLSEAAESASLGLWETHLIVPTSVGTGEDGELFFPSGLGRIFSNPAVSTGGSVDGNYPSGGCSMQFMALADDSNKEEDGLHTGLYVAAHDENAWLKDLWYTTAEHAAAHARTTGARLNSPAVPREARIAATGSSAATATTNPTAATTTVNALSVVAYPEDSGKPLESGYEFAVPYPVAVGPVRGVGTALGKPLYFGASQIYRAWSTKEAKWTQKGPLSARTGNDKVPSWYTDSSIWLNTHWQCHDIFNKTGGEPAFVQQYVKEVAAVLQQPSLLLHWYEWQQGPSPAPADRYLFDTHYPDYMPSRVGFKEAIADLQATQGVYTIPYINGRIFDINSNSFLEEDGEKYCTKTLKHGPRLVTPASQTQLQVTYETYGSNATFCVANPYTRYWQEKLTDASVSLVADYGAAGVYIDQIGAAKPLLCWDDSMRHPLGGGTYWSDGYEQALQAINARLPGASKSPIVTEDASEAYMDSLDGFLVLTSFKKGLSQAPQRDALERAVNVRVAPALNAVYGGYYTAMGAEWMITDFADHAWFAGKLSSQLHSGAQLGWFGLAGLDDGQDQCGPMGMGPAMLDAANAPAVDFLRLAAAYRRVAAASFMVNGRLACPTQLHPPAQALFQTPAAAIEQDKHGLLQYDSLSMSAWHEGETPQQSGGEGIGEDKGMKTMALFTCNTPSKGYKGRMRVDMQAWGYAARQKLRVSRLSTTADAFDAATGEQQVHTQPVGTVTGPEAWLDVEVGALDALMLIFEPM